MKTLKVFAQATDTSILYYYIFNKEKSSLFMDYERMLRTAEMLHGTFKIKNVYERSEPQSATDTETTSRVRSNVVITKSKTRGRVY